ncbi:MAG: 3-hydroxyacyl-CoA dehydrogenase [Bacilli bacterium]|nr:3-hydroxyacyl-CoA dehydrogenase [Bacilli bacterium]
MRNVVVAGGGVLGSQIAFQAAYCGHDVTIWLRSEASVGRAQAKIDNLKDIYTKAIELMETSENPADWCIGIASTDAFNKEECLKKVEEAHKNIKLIVDMKEAVKDADIVIESVAEDTKEKIAFYQALAPLLKPECVIATNSSTLLPSTFAKYTGRADKYLSMHFANYIWKNNVAEVMVQKDTKKEAFDTICTFAEEIRMLPLKIEKEKNGYLLNSMLVPLLLSGLDLYVNGVSSPKDIDTAWKTGTGAPRGPFEIFDVVGIATAYHIVQQYQKVPGLISPLLKKMMMPYNFKGMEKVLKEMLDAGKTGRAAGEGFYKYN